MLINLIQPVGYVKKIVSIFITPSQSIDMEQ